MSLVFVFEDGFILRGHAMHVWATYTIRYDGRV